MAHQYHGTLSIHALHTELAYNNHSNKCGLAVPQRSHGPSISTNTSFPVSKTNTRVFEFQVRKHDIYNRLHNIENSNMSRSVPWESNH